MPGPPLLKLLVTRSRLLQRPCSCCSATGWTVVITRRLIGTCRAPAVDCAAPHEKFNSRSCSLMVVNWPPFRVWLRARSSAMMRSRLLTCCTHSCAAADWTRLFCFDAAKTEEALSVLLRSSAGSGVPTSSDLQQHREDERSRRHAL